MGQTRERRGASRIDSPDPRTFTHTAALPATAVRVRTALALLLLVANAICAADASCYVARGVDGKGVPRYEIVVGGSGVDAAVNLRYAIAPVGEGGKVGASTAGEADSVPYAPWGARLVPLNATAVRVSWNPPGFKDRSSDIVGYRIRRDGNLVHPRDLGADARVHTDATVPPNSTTFAYAVTAVNGFGEGPGAGIGASELPAPPQRVRAVMVGGAVISVNWSIPASTPDAIVRYEVLLDDNEAAITSVAAPPVNLTVAGGLVLGRAYIVRVRSVGSRGSTSVQFSQPPLVDFAPPPAPATVRVEVGARAPTIRWDPSERSGVPTLGYLVRRNGVQIAALNATSFVHAESEALAVGAVYVYGVCAVNAAGSGPMLESAPYAHATVPGALASLRASSYLNPYAVTVAWTPPSDVKSSAPASYEIHRNGARIASVPSSILSYADSGFAAGIVSYGVRAANSLGLGPFSNYTVDTLNIGVPTVTDAEMVFSNGVYTYRIWFQIDSYGVLGSNEGYQYNLFYTTCCSFWLSKTMESEMGILYTPYSSPISVDWGYNPAIVSVRMMVCVWYYKRCSPYSNTFDIRGAIPRY